MKHFRWLFLVAVVLGCEKNTPTELSNYDLIFFNARIIDVTSASVSEPSFIGIQDDTIRIVSTMSEATGIRATRMIDLEGQYVMPGLWDNHVHFRGGKETVQENQRLLPLFLAYGVTTVRDAGGDITPAVLQWQNSIRNGAMIGPDIFSSGPKLDGDQPAWEGSIQVTTRDDVTAALDSLAILHTDYVKMYDGNLTAEMYYEIIRQAEERGWQTTGHMPMDADLLNAANLGLDGTEHMYYVLNATSPIGDSLRATGQGYRLLGALLDSYDEDFAMVVYRELAKRPFYVNPTLYIGQVLNTLPVDDHSQDSLLKYIGPGIRATYQRRINGAMNRSQEAQLLDDRLEARFAAMVRPMQQAGIKIVAGSDCGPSNSYVYPGASMIGELEALVALGGLTPAQALHSSIVNGPAFLGLSEFYGSLSPGKVGDLLILNENPLEDISNIRSLNLVIVNGNIIAAQKLLK